MRYKKLARFINTVVSKINPIVFGVKDELNLPHKKLVAFEQMEDPDNYVLGCSTRPEFAGLPGVCGAMICELDYFIRELLTDIKRNNVLSQKNLHELINSISLGRILEECKPN